MVGTKQNGKDIKFLGPSRCRSKVENGEPTSRSLDRIGCTTDNEEVIKSVILERWEKMRTKI